MKLKSKVTDKDEIEKGKILYNELVKDLRLFYVYEALQNRPKRIEEVASSHDMTFFQNPAQIIAGKISAPILEVDNEKIAQRHLNSIVIAWFFKERPEFFENNTKRIVEAEGEHDMAIELRLMLENHPENLLASIHNALPTKVCVALGVDEWRFIDEITGEDGSLTRAIRERTADINGLRQFREGLNPDSSKADIGRVKSADKLIDTLESEKSINFLSAKGVLPKYGFPIDTVSIWITEQ